MSSQRANSARIASCTAASACSMPPRVSSEKTTPKPNVSSGALRSQTVISWPGPSCFASAAKYRPAGPPPMTAIRTSSRVCRPVHDRQQDDRVSGWSASTRRSWVVLQASRTPSRLRGASSSLLVRRLSTSRTTSSATALSSSSNALWATCSRRCVPRAGRRPTCAASRSTPSTWTTTGRTRARSARSGGGSRARTTRPWPESASLASGTRRRWSRSKASRSSPLPDAPAPNAPTPHLTAADHLGDVRARGGFEVLVQGEEDFGRADPGPAGRQVLRGQAGAEIGHPAPAGERQDVVGERFLARRGLPVLLAAQRRAVFGDEGGVQLVQPVEVPPLANLGPDVAEREMLGPEQVCVTGQPEP